MVPEVEGYRFKGWYLTPDCSGEPDGAYSHWLDFTGNMTLYAGWEKTAQVTYFVSGEETTEDEVVGQTLQYIPKLSSGEGYIFLGWFLTSACLEEDKIDPETYLVEGDVTLYAGWDVEVYDITYNLNGGVNNPANPDSYTIEDTYVGEGEPLTILAPTREGYYLADYEVTGPVKTIDTDPISWWIEEGSYGDVTLTVQWTPIDLSLIHI